MDKSSDHGLIGVGRTATQHESKMPAGKWQANSVVYFKESGERGTVLKTESVNSRKCRAGSKRFENGLQCQAHTRKLSFVGDVLKKRPNSKQVYKPNCNSMQHARPRHALNEIKHPDLMQFMDA